MDELQDVFIREFPEFRSVFPQLVNHRELIEILNEYRSCELALIQINKSEEMIDSYRELMNELKLELRSCISRHLGNQNSNT